MDIWTRQLLTKTRLGQLEHSGPDNGRHMHNAKWVCRQFSEAVFMSTRVLVMSARPGRIVAEYEIPFSYPRSPELRFDPEFARLSGEISHALRGSHS